MNTQEQLEKDVLDFLQKSKTAVLGTIAPGGEPQAATITYVWDDDYNFYFATHTDSRKYRNLEHDPRVSIVVGTDPKTLRTVQAQGTAEKISGAHFLVRYFSKIVNLSEPEWWPLLSIAGLDYAFFQVKISWLRMLDARKQAHPQTYRARYFQILPRPQADKEAARR